MSVPATTGAGGLALPDDLLVGLEDYDPATDIVTPRLVIQHKKGTYQNSLSKEEFTELEVVTLGVVKQRAMWPAVFDGSDDPPLCKSQDFNYGNPGDKFPWAASGFNPADYANEGDQLPCGSCPLALWGSHPNNKTAPWCGVQHVYIVLMKDIEGEYTMPALFTAVRTGIKPSQTYMSSFQQAKKPMFLNTTKLGLELLKRGVNEYCVPEFTQGDPTNKSIEEYRVWANMYRQMRTFVQSMRKLADDVTASAPAATPATSASPSASPSAAPVAGSSKDDEIPF